MELRVFQIQNFAFALLSLSAVAVCPAEDTFSPEQIEFFEKEIRPVLADNCYECHTGTKAKVGLQLNSREKMLRGTDYHKVIDLEAPEKSLLLRAIKHGGPEDRWMPKDAAKLPDDTIAAFEKWIGMQLPWPEEIPQDGTTDPEDHWSFKPVVKPQLPDDYKGNAIDYFISQKREAVQLEPAPKADRYTLYRRIHFNLLGLPPKYEDARKFIDDPRPDEEVWPEVITELLKSPHYGERWARHWMDVARYSDTKGYEAGGRERRFVYSYTYRDWLIRALNDDMPFDQFLRYQLAAEQLVDPESPEKQHLAALGFITLSKNGKQELVVDDRLDTTFRGMMGLTVACARCHDHKFDPISTKEYYGLYGVFMNSIEPEEKPVIGEPKAGPEYDAYLKDLAKQQKVVDDFLEPKLAKLAEENPNIANRRAALIGKLERADRRKLQNLERVVDKFVADRKMEPDKALVIEDRPKAVDQAVFIRGNPGRRGDVAPRKFLSIIAGEDAPEFKNGSGRLEMAHAITDPKNPLTARVIVNRVWMWHFGEGIVKTVSDFGTQGEPPSHPELLDYLAAWFVENGWSIKKLHRLILESDTYQLSSQHPRQEEFAVIDPENQLLWKMNRQRLDMEQMRDGILEVSNGLSDEMFGRTVKIFEEPYSDRRSVYAYIDRQNLSPVFRNFDFSNPQETTGKRPSTTIPMQTLFAMNSGFLHKQSSNLVKTTAEAEDKIGAFHRAVFAEDPDEKQRVLAESFVNSFESEFKKRSESQTITEWSYGWGKVTPETHQVDFKPFTHWKDGRWQIGKEWPIKDDPKSYLFIKDDGSGHAGYDAAHSLILRWQSPADMNVRIIGTIERPNVGKGDGIRAKILVGGQAPVLSKALSETERAMPTNVDQIAVKKGEFIYFVTDSGEKGNSSFDSINWQPEIRSNDNESDRWSFRNQFAGPADFSTAWESYAQALLISNQFQFVD